MGELIEDCFPDPGTWMWAMRQHHLGHAVRRRSTGIKIPPKGDWSISSEDALALDWELAPKAKQR